MVVRSELSQRGLFARLLRVAWDYKGGCARVLGTQLALLGLSALGFRLAGAAIDVVHHTLDPHAPPARLPLGLGALHAPDPLVTVVWLSGAIAALALLRTWLSFSYTYGVAELVQGRIVPELRSRVYTKLQTLSFRYYDQNAAGSLLNRVTSDVQYLRSFVDGVLIQALVLVFTVLVYGIGMVRSHPLLAAACLGTTPGLWWVTLRFSERVLPAHAHSRKQSDALVSALSEAIHGMAVVKGFGSEAHFLEDLAQRNRVVLEGQGAIFRALSRYTAVVDLLSQSNVAVLLLYGGWLVVDGALSVGDLVVFAGMLQQVSQQAMLMSTIMSTLQESLIGARRVFEVLDAPVDVEEPVRPVATPARRGSVSFRDVHFGYGGPTSALSGIDLEISPGELVAFFGATGAGKSSLLSLVPRFYDVTAGCVCVDGVDVRAQSLSELRARVGFVFQESFLFSNTIAANIAFGRPEASRAEVERAARAASAHEFIVDKPEGYDTLLGEHGADLSGGQRQRLAIARALLTDPAILVLDDPTAALDADTAERVLLALRSAARGRTCLLATQRRSLLRSADRVVVLEHGRVVQVGTHHELLACAGPYRDAWAEPASLQAEKTA